MTPKFLLFAIPILLLLMFLEMIVDKIRNGKRFSLPDTLTNISCGIGNQGLNMFTKGLKLFLFIDIFFGKLAIMTIPHAWWSVLLCLIVLDIAFYWEHRISHVVNIFWGTHVVHHSSEEFNLSIALRRSWVADLVVLFFFLPIPALGFGGATFLTAVAIHNFYQFIIHTRAVPKLHPIIEYIMHTPSHHRVHHGKDPKYIDKNFSGVFIIWDRVFGTFQEEEEEPTYGITTQLKTYNPALVNIHYYADLLRNVRMMPTWKDKIKMLFGKPGWFPKEFGGYKAPPEVDKAAYQKYRANTPKTLNAYVTVQFIIGFIGLLAMLLAKEYLKTDLFSPGYLVGFFILVALAATIPVALFDRAEWLSKAEHFRLILILAFAVIYVYFERPEFLFTTLIIGGISYLLMNRWFAWVWAKRYIN